MRYGLIYVVLMSCVLLWGCSSMEAEYVIPECYSGQGTMRVYTDKSTNEYEIDVREGPDSSFNLTVSNGGIAWSIVCNGDKCTFSNNKFEASSVNIDNFKILDSLMSDFDLSKFELNGKASGDDVSYRDGVFTHVLAFNNKSYLPEKITVYKNDFLVKTIEYNDIKIE